jgi:hypothetical protein
LHNFKFILYNFHITCSSPTHSKQSKPKRAKHQNAKSTVLPPPKIHSSSPLSKTFPNHQFKISKTKTPIFASLPVPLTITSQPNSPTLPSIISKGKSASSPNATPLVYHLPNSRPSRKFFLSKIFHTNQPKPAKTHLLTIKSKTLSSKINTSVLEAYTEMKAED